MKKSNIGLLKILYQVIFLLFYDSYTLINISRYITDMICPCEITVNKVS